MQGTDFVSHKGRIFAGINTGRNFSKIAVNILAQGSVGSNSMEIGFQIESGFCIAEFFHKGAVESIVLGRNDSSGSGGCAAANGICFTEQVVDTGFFRK